MSNHLLSKLFDSKIQSEIESILNNDFINFKRTKIRLSDDTYYFIKVSEKAMVFSSLIYNMFTEKAYLQPIACIFEDNSALLYPTLYDFYNPNNYYSTLKIIKLGKSERLLMLVSSSEIINHIYENKHNLLNGASLSVTIDDVSFTISDLFNSSLHFHIDNGQTHIASYDYNLLEYTNELVLGKFTFNNDFIEKSEFLKKYKLIVNSNEIDLN